MLITVGENQFTHKQIKQLEGVVKKHAEVIIGSQNALTLWNMVPQGNGYNDYEARQSSLVMIECEDNLPQEKRVVLFQTITKEWLAITRQSIDHLVIAVLENETFNDFLKRNGRHLTTWGKVKMYAHMISSMLRSKMTHNYYAFTSSF